jgi:hypothetical protein
MTNLGLKREGGREEILILIIEPIYYYISYYNYLEGVEVGIRTILSVSPRRTLAASLVSKNLLFSLLILLKRGISPKYYTLRS